ncbi:hypothetical protein FOCC_FOCC005422 [Frankliniella occidentalis]|nr:hypothetical protein FOCC_FOCC005422 [Frankliniella occidentalis]
MFRYRESNPSLLDGTRRMLGLLVALVLALAQLAPSDAKPAHAVQMDAIDTCLFTCDACYKVFHGCLQKLCR